MKFRFYYQSLGIRGCIGAGLFFFLSSQLLFSQRIPDLAPKTQDPEAIAYYYPIYPREFLLKGKKGKAIVRFVLEEDGKVGNIVAEKATHRRFADAAVEALKYWEFKPYIRKGISRKIRLRQTFVFRPSETSYFSLEPAETPKTSYRPFPISAHRPMYPKELRSQKVEGNADVIITVDPSGKVTETNLENTTHELFGPAAIQAAKQWKFHPAHPTAIYQHRVGVRPAYVNPGYGKAKMRLTFLFKP